MSDYKQKFENYKNALNRLNDGIMKFDQTNDLLRDGLIQRFEFTFELAWKALKAIFEEEGLTGLNSPKTVLREAFSAGLIEKDELWLAMLSDRNTTAHIYNEQLAIEICNKIIKEYVCEFGQLKEQIKMRMGI
ncbi:nucleotidyltransferase substrate binding protein [Pelosinus fermentans]|uniref:Nucleotidyltransferase substrate binding protein, HI0074 family n=1 Tax=Pelosinus fermentans JBW45 TaxID=1192197 RepID=I8U5S5_9FIRM|nr:nucleotidyltransferase substrate binding protein [Pelosinus fermentans]AJQ27942.1 nucleotidyltransferase substrate binding protein, HI0074 family [Pelosinus fermentans JBW45]